MAKKDTKVINTRLLPHSIARLLNGVKISLNSTVNGNALSNQTGISHSEIYRLRSGKRKISKLSLGSCVRLASYPDENMEHIYLDKIKGQVYTALNCGLSIHQLSYRSGVRENTLYKLNQNDNQTRSGHIFNIENISIFTLAKVISCYEFIMEHHLLDFYKNHPVTSNK